MYNWGPKTDTHIPLRWHGVTEPVILHVLRPEVMHASQNHQPAMHSLINLETYSDNNKYKL